MNRKIKKILILISTLATITINVLANSLPINGITTGEVSDSINSFFVPAGYVFAIWLVIYAGLIVFTIYLFLSKKENKWIDKVWYWYILAAISNIVWLFLWHYEEILLSVAPMVVLLLSLIMTYIRMNVRYDKAQEKDQSFLFKLPISIYLSWIAVATIANISSALVTLGWGGFGLDKQIWTSILLGVSGVLALSALSFRKDYAYAAVYLWAIVGIGLKFFTESIIPTSVVAMVILVLIEVIITIIDHFKKKKKES